MKRLWIMVVLVLLCMMFALSGQAEGQPFSWGTITGTAYTGEASQHILSLHNNNQTDAVTIVGIDIIDDLNGMVSWHSKPAGSVQIAANGWLNDDWIFTIDTRGGQSAGYYDATFRVTYMVGVNPETLICEIHPPFRIVTRQRATLKVNSSDGNVWYNNIENAPATWSVFITNHGDTDATNLDISSINNYFDIIGSLETVQGREVSREWQIVPKVHFPGQYTDTVTVSYDTGAGSRDSIFFSLDHTIYDSNFTLYVHSIQFETLQEGYAPQSYSPIRMYSQALSFDLHVDSISLQSDSAFIIDSEGADPLVKGTWEINDSFRIRPRDNLSAGNYNETLTVKYDYGKTAVTDVMLVVEKSNAVNPTTPSDPQVPSAAPMPPTDFSADPISGGVMLYWQLPNDESIIGYEITIDDGSGRFALVEPTTSSLAIYDMNNEQSYTFQIRSFSATEMSEIVTVSCVPRAEKKEAGTNQLPDDYEDLSYINVPINRESARVHNVNDYANIRSGPGMEYDIIGKVYANEAISLIKWSDDEQWCQVEYNGGNNAGWLSYRFVGVGE